MRVLFLTNLPSPYMVDFFNELGRLCDLTVIFERSFSSERNGRWSQYSFSYFKGIVLKGLHTSPDAALSPSVVKYLKPKRYDYIVVTNPATPTGMLAIEYMRMRRIPYILESEGSFPKDGRGLKEKVKMHIMKGAFAYFSTTPKADNYFLAYGADKDRIYHYPFTSLYRREILLNPLSAAEKEKLRKELHMEGRKAAIAVGRLIPLKRYGLLIESWKDMPEDYSLYIVGEGEEEEALRKIIDLYSLQHVYLTGYKEKKELLQYYCASDLFVHPTSTDVWGLVINEAMACGLPVITTDMCIAGEALIEEGVNGYIVPVDDRESLKEKIKVIMEDDTLREGMSEHSLKKVEEFTYESMAARHMELFGQLH